jgi:hypothetical protein
MGWTALPNLRAVYVAYVDVESNRGVGTNLDGTRKSDIDLHRPSLPEEIGVARADQNTRIR